ncbi:MAG: hypothetical protein HEP70_20450, partial [Rhodobiaceae bacterium]|nr:hypothetical protein [Rhodobiaceae bacterium]
MRKLFATTSIISALAMPLGASMANEVVPVVHPDLVSVSQLSVPLSIDLAHLQSRANAALAGRLHTFNEKNVHCVKAKWFKTKVPEFRGLKIYSKIVKTKISPDLYCDLRGHVDRPGNLAITGNGSPLTFSLPTHATQPPRQTVIRKRAKPETTFSFG